MSSKKTILFMASLIGLFLFACTPTEFKDVDDVGNSLDEHMLVGSVYTTPQKNVTLAANSGCEGYIQQRNISTAQIQAQSGEYI